MWWLLGLALGAALGMLLPVPLPAGTQVYAAMAALAAVDSAAGGALARQRGEFSSREFWEGMMTSALFACAVAWLGKALDVQLHLAAAAALCLRAFHSLSQLRKGRNVREVLPSQRLQKP